jgi:hypothetical protein
MHFDRRINNISGNFLNVNHVSILRTLMYLRVFAS